MTSLGGIELQVDEWGIDAIYSGTQKCLSCVPGLSPVSFSERAARVIRERKSKVQSWFLDLNLVMGYWGSDAKRSYHHTAPVNSLYALHESLIILQEEGLQKALAVVPDLILLDMGLPDIDGQTVAGLIKGSSLLSNVPLVAVTAWPQDVAEEMARAYGCDGYFSKPIKAREFAGQVAKYFKS